MRLSQFPIALFFIIFLPSTNGQNNQTFNTCLDKLFQTEQVFRLEKIRNIRKKKKRLFPNKNRRSKYISKKIYDISYLKFQTNADTIIVVIEGEKKSNQIKLFCQEYQSIAVEEDAYLYVETVMLQLLLTQFDFENQGKTVLPKLNYKRQPRFFGVTDTFNYRLPLNIIEGDTIPQYGTAYEGTVFEISEDKTTESGTILKKELTIKGVNHDLGRHVDNTHEYDLTLYFSKDTSLLKIKGNISFSYFTPAFRKGTIYEIDMTLLKPQNLE